MADPTNAPTDVAIEDVEAETPPLFHDVIFTVVPHSSLGVEETREIVASLEEEGADYMPFSTDDNRIEDLRALTHIISTTSDFPQYEDALDTYIHVVKPSWIGHCLDKGKQLNPRQFSPDPNFIFSDVIVSCADIPQGDAEAIHGGVLALGGLYSANLTKQTTHLVALNHEDERCQIAVRKNLMCKIVLPHWFNDCLKLGRRLHETPYLLPNPDILRKHDKMPAPKISPSVTGACSPHPTDALPSPSPSLDGSPRLNVFKNKHVMFAKDLGLGENLTNTISSLVTTGCGKVVNDIDLADTYICRYREGEDYVSASQEGKDVGNLAWIYHLITTNQWISPMRRVLHYPVPPQGVPGFMGKKICVSNYSGDARLYLEHLIKACGAEFTKTMSQSNTHLITAHTKSEKCDAALEWGIEVVNHLWLEDSYARCQMQSLTVKRYTHFPERVNLGEVIGQTPLDRVVLEKTFYPRPKKQAARPRVESDEPLHEVENMDIDDRPNARKSNRNHNANMTPAVRKFGTAGKENETPGSKGPKNRAHLQLHEATGLTTPNLSFNAETPGSRPSRGAKDQANAKLHDAAIDIDKFNKEMKRVGGVLHGKERRSSTEQAVTTKEPRGRKRQSTEMDEENADTESEEEEEADISTSNGHKVKRSKTAKITNGSYKMVLTGYQRWIDDAKAEATERNILRNLGIHITEDVKNVDILCAPKIVRTKKFVCALASAPYVVNTDFIEYCVKKKQVPDPAKYPLHDRDTEDRLGIKLSDSLENAENNNKKMLETWQIFCTEQIIGGFDTFKSIIEANGGTCLLYKGRTAMTLSKRKGTGDSQDQEDRKEDLYLISGTLATEKSLWPKFRQLAEKADMRPVIAKSDWLLSIAMRHEIHWDDKWALNEQA